MRVKVVIIVKEPKTKQKWRVKTESGNRGEKRIAALESHIREQQWNAKMNS